MSYSLQARLSCGLVVCLLLMTLTAGGFAFLTVFRGDKDLQDDELRHVAEIINARLLEINEPSGHFTGEHGEMYFHLLQPHTTANSLPFDLPHNTADGFYTLHDGDKEWRVYIFTRTQGQRIALAEQTVFRQAEALRVAVAAVLPLPLLMLCMFLGLTWLMSRFFTAVNNKARALDQRDEQNFNPLDLNGLPTEILPFVGAINRLLARVKLHVSQQQRFIADAAHELRTPLTALSLQAERLDAPDLPEVSRTHLTSLRQGLDRTVQMLNQLLTLARAQGGPRQCEELSLPTLFRQVLEELMPVAERKGIDLGVTSQQDVFVLASPAEVTTLLRSLLGNALRYTPEGGQVDLHAGRKDGRAYFSVIDSGPGIPEAELKHVFTPFYRVGGPKSDGVGLGLAIVQAVADRLGATVELTCGPNGRGLQATVRFAQAGQPQPDTQAPGPDKT